MKGSSRKGQLFAGWVLVASFVVAPLQEAWSAPKQSRFVTADIGGTITDSPDPYSGPLDTADGIEDGVSYVVRVTNHSATTKVSSYTIDIFWSQSSYRLRTLKVQQGSCQVDRSWDTDGMRCALGSLAPGQVIEISLNMATCIDGDEVGWLAAHLPYTSWDPNWDNNEPMETTAIVTGSNLC